MADKKLTEKQKRFAVEYLKDGNAAQAAVRAGYSKKTARFTGAENLTKPNIKAYIEEQLERIHNERTADAREVIEYLTSVMRGEQSDEVLKWIGGGMQSTTKIAVAAKDRMKAAELLGKYYSLWTDKVNVNADTQVTFVEDMKPDE